MIKSGDIVIKKSRGEGIMTTTENVMSFGGKIDAEHI